MECFWNAEAKFITREENQWYKESASASGCDQLPGFSGALEMEK